MSGLSDTSSLGFSSYITRAEAESIGSRLDSLWVETAGRPRLALTEDLEYSRRWFDPVAQGQRLRKELAALPGMPTEWSDPGQPWTIRVDASRFLLTPEGLCALDLLDGLPEDVPGHVLVPSQLAKYERLLNSLYREWSRHRLNSVIELLQGTTKPLQVPASGVVLALLVNRCTTEERALTRFASGAKREMVDKAFFAPVQAFSEAIAPGRRGNRNDPRLVSGWMLYEAGRRIGPGLVIQDAKKGQDGKVWLEGNAVDGVISLLARDLQRGHRTKVTAASFAQAFEMLVVNLRDELPALAPFGLAHERPLETARLRNHLLKAWAQSGEATE